MKLKLSVLSLSLMAVAAINSAYAIEVNGTVVANAVATAPAARAGDVQPVVLMQVKLNKEELRALNGVRRAAAAKRSNVKDNTLPAKADVGMNGTPVLNQGMHGSCVTFATTGAFDALIGKGDYVSQLCSLELGSYLEKHAYAYSGWEGSFGPLVLNQFMTHGLVSIAKQKEKGCGGVHAYPVSSSSKGNPVSLDEYHGLSEKVSNHFYWEPILSVYQFSYNTLDHEYDADKVVNEVKKELALKRPMRESRVTFGTILPYRMCSVGACAKFHQNNDTWAITKSMEREFDNWELGGHEMIIIGYDDDAVVTDNEGGTHKGIFTIRNSWGTGAGDKGNYYMTYDFFKRFVMEAQRLIKTDDSWREGR